MLGRSQWMHVLRSFRYRGPWMYEEALLHTEKSEVTFHVQSQPSSDASDTLLHSNDRLGSRVDIKVQINTLQMLLNGAWTDFERERNFLIRQSLLEPGQDLAFSL